MPKGGKREGSGRKKGSSMVRSAREAKRLIGKGISPLEYLCNVMRDENAPKGERLDAAKSAAPYMHPRLQAVEGSFDVTNYTHEQALGELDE